MNVAMNAVWKIFLSMSCSGSLLILAFFLGKRFLKDKISRQWQYYIWLIVILRLLLPFGSETNLMGKAYQAIDKAITQATSLPQQQNSPTISSDFSASVLDLEQSNGQVDSPKTDSPTEALESNSLLQGSMRLLLNHLWLVWLVLAASLLIRKATIYQSFVRYVNAGLSPVSDVEILDQLSIAAEQMGIHKPIELCVNPLISSPLLLGFFHPCIVLPSLALSEKAFRHIVLHELTHYKRHDLFYKWLVQVTVCLHWFNPLIHLMSREIAWACEFSCDEAVLANMGYDHAADYGKTLLDAMAAVGKYKESLGTLTLSENKQLLKERLGAIMSYKKKSMAVRCLTGLLTLGILFGASVVGVYSSAATKATANEKPSKSTQADKYVKVDFSGISITGKGPVGVELVRTNKSKVTFEYLNMDDPKQCATSAKVVNGIMKIKITHSAPNGVNVDFGSKPKNVVRVYIPNAIYKEFSITSKQMVLRMQDFNAPVCVNSKEAGFRLVDTDISRGSYDIHVTSGPIYIEADTIQKDITANADNGPLTVRFHKKPKNLYLDTTNCGPVIDRPADWPAIYRVGNETPKLLLSNYGPLTIELADKTEKQSEDAATLAVSFAQDFINQFNGTIAGKENIALSEYIGNSNLLAFAKKMIMLTQKQEKLGRNAVTYGAENKFNVAECEEIDKGLYYVKTQFQYEGSGMLCQLLIKKQEDGMEIMDFYFGTQDGVDTISTGHHAEREVSNPNIWKEEAWVMSVYEKLLAYEGELQ